MTHLHVTAHHAPTALSALSGDTPPIGGIIPAMDESLRKQLAPGVKVDVIQQIPHRDRVWTETVHGTVVAYQQRQTGSWFAHSKNDKLWLDRLILRLDDGEITTLNLDDYTHLTILGPAAEGETAEPQPASTGEPAVK